ncbi:hypothetical protein V1264_008758 [Littorina saxatilis]|uniref:PHD-type domain-containing protein n=1 Tax=Littorina saxatilis TaxID=31220 RepID=A0AAN9G339_9CAEN
MESAVDCIVCQVAVTSRQEALLCDGPCGRWHRICGIGIDRATYRRAVRGELELDWRCQDCVAVAQSELSLTQQAEMEVGGDDDDADSDDEPSFAVPMELEEPSLLDSRGKPRQMGSAVSVRTSGTRGRRPRHGPRRVTVGRFFTAPSEPTTTWRVGIVALTPRQHGAN